MKLLQINAVYGTGSTGQMVRDISLKLVEQGSEAYVFWATACKIFGEKDDKIKIERVGNTLDHKMHALLYRLFGGQAMFSKRATVRACKRILQISPDVVHLHNLHSNYIHFPTLLEFLARQNITTLITLHDCWFMSGQCNHYINYNCDKWLSECEDCPAVSRRLKKGVRERFQKKKDLLSNIKHLFVNGVSEWTTVAAKKSILRSATNIECIYNWIDTDVFKPYEDLESVREKYGISKDKKIIIGVSQSWDMNSNKGTTDFITIADRLSDIAEIILVGKDNGVCKRENVKCIGFTSSAEELARLYSLADVLINASRAETFGLVTVEAMACGTPVVAYDNTGSSEIVADGCGVLVNDGDFEALLCGVKEVLSKNKNEYSRACRDHVNNNFEKNKQIEKYIKLYQKICI